MAGPIRWGLLVLCCARAVVSQSTVYKFTMNVSPAPIPGQPFTITWTGGEPTELVYITLNNYFPPVTSQNIPYGSTDILSDAPNNGSWIYHVPGDIPSGRHSFSIGYNPFMLSDTSDVFVINPSETFPVAPAPSTSLAPGQSWTYNGCGLPPLPDYTYTGYQPPCTVTTNGHITTLYPIVPASDSASFFGSLTSQVPAPAEVTSSNVIPSTSGSINSAFATDIYAQALQCPTSITPSATSIVATDSTTTIFSLLDCGQVWGWDSASSLTSRRELFSTSALGASGICHTSGYSTFSVSGTSSVCCPDGWGTTPLLSTELYCFTSMADAGLEKRQEQASTQTVEQGTNTVVFITGLAFTRAGVVVDAASQTGSTRGTLTSTQTTGPSATSTTGKSGGTRVERRVREMLAVVCILSYFILQEF